MLQENLLLLRCIPCNRTKENLKAIISQIKRAKIRSEDSENLKMMKTKQLLKHHHKSSTMTLEDENR